MKALVEVCSLRLPFLLEYQHDAVDTATQYLSVNNEPLFGLISFPQNTYMRFL